MGLRQSMKLMFPESFRLFAIVSVITVFALFTGSVDAQRRGKVTTKPIAKKVERKTKDAKKDNKKGKESVTARSKKDQKKAEDKRSASNTKTKSKESKKEIAERKRKELERQAAIAAERRRREQAAREARARKIAFERGLRTETVANISNDITEGEDLNIRRAAVEALGDRAGSVVVMEAQTGKVLTVVNQDWAIRSSIRPCSTIKLVTGVAGISEGVISKEDGSITDSSTRIGLDDALAYSNNAYFQRAGSNVGNEKVIMYAQKLGLGQPTGINADGETAGRLPFGNKTLRIYSHGDDYEVSTIQLAVMVSAIANGGHRVLPRTPRNQAEKIRFQTFYKQDVDVRRQDLRRVIPGMMGAAEYGTARRGVNAALGIAGKTGSCIDKGSWVGLFASVAPIEAPKYAVAVITRGQGERGKFAAAVAGKIYQALSNNIVRTDRNLAQTEFNLIAKPTAISSSTAITTDDDDDDDTAEVDSNAETNGGRDVIIVPSSPAEKRYVQRTSSSKPIFPPVVITYESDSKKKTGSNVRPKN